MHMSSFVLIIYYDVADHVHEIYPVPEVLTHCLEESFVTFPHCLYVKTRQPITNSIMKLQLRK